jgi:membrane protease YdiL (CAAX protease family)
MLPPHRRHAVPWTGIEVLIVFFLAELFWGTLVGLLLNKLGFFVALFGEDFQRILEEQASPDGALALDRWRLWVSVISFPLNLATILVVLRLLSNTRYYQLGLTTHRLGRNILIGVLGWLCLTPIVLGMNDLVRRAYAFVTLSSPKDNALAVLSRSHPSVLEQVLIVLSAVVIAPLMEELLYRGILQRWLSRQPWGGLLAWSLALGLAATYRFSLIKTAWITHDWNAVLEALQPTAFVIALLPGLWLLGRVARPQAARAIFGTSLLFAVRHVAVWPDPVALFVLSLGLGWMADRTRSLVGPIVLHSLFNSVGCVLMYWA